MTTKKLYYKDQYNRSFTANVVKVSKDEKERDYVVLDQTHFYPTGGGQPHDTGTLQDVRVYDVEEVDGEIRHFIEKPLIVHNELVGKIDWNRRFDHMQQHAGQHILSAILEDDHGYPTVSFHLGKTICSIDIKAHDLSDEEARQVEEKANQLILENHPIETKWVTDEELSNFTLRKAVSVTDNIRLVIIPTIDYNGCGGTHPQSTGEISSIKVLHLEKQKKNIRVYFVCGNRVLNQLHEKHHVIQGLTSQLSAPQEKLVEATEQVLQQNKNQEKRIDQLKTQLLKSEAKTLIDEAKWVHNRKIVKAIFQNRSMKEMQQLAKLIPMKTSQVVVLLVSENDTKLQLVCSRSDDVVISMNKLVKQVLPVIDGKGGGNDSVAQGGGDRSLSAEQFMEELGNAVNKLK
ncbi:alanyl-tRNA editing protein [Oceanobacillus halotolerans]|uniref:alanyl-tRNA editing protein n=1 Tax=Oceanobacillus halotolerans TaxID=2663380 RepID=UPI0013DADE14|nr:DHHA1 domain-containing protein [Oceanobacillus halotolerans]